MADKFDDNRQRCHCCGVTLTLKERHEGDLCKVCLADNCDDCAPQEDEEEDEDD